jgi:GTP cyclohydrolase I
MNPEHLITELIGVIGDNPMREGLVETPKRVIKSYKELFAGYAMEPSKILSTQFHETGSDEIIVCKDIEMFSTCEHHMLPFFGRASVGYIPRDGIIVGLSKLARIVECFSRRLQNQERITSQIADSIDIMLNPIAVGVVVEAEHFCMRARGVSKQNSKMVTSKMKGQFRDSPEARSEFLRLCGR